MRRKAIWMAAGVLLVLLVLAARHEATKPDPEVAQYCELVALNRKNAELGWPDFHHIFDDVCNADGTVKEQK